MTASPVLATLAADPARIVDVQPDQVPELVGACAALQAALLLRLQAPPVAAAPQGSTGGGPDRLLTAKEAGERLGVASRWLYRHAEDLPFTRRLSGGTVRFSERGLAKWQETRR